jgi:hypothetical protein
MINNIEKIDSKIFFIWHEKFKFVIFSKSSNTKFKINIEERESIIDKAKGSIFFEF